MEHTVAFYRRKKSQMTRFLALSWFFELVCQHISIKKKKKEKKVGRDGNICRRTVNLVSTTVCSWNTSETNRFDTEAVYHYEEALWC